MNVPDKLYELFEEQFGALPSKDVQTIAIIAIPAFELMHAYDERLLEIAFELAEECIEEQALTDGDACPKEEMLAFLTKMRDIYRQRAELVSQSELTTSYIHGEA